MKKLDLYIIRKFLGTFFFSLVLILCIVVVFDLSEKLEKFLENEAPLKASVFDYYKNFIPYFANVFSSLFTFISVIFFTSKMAYDSEIIAILSTGISFSRFFILPSSAHFFLSPLDKSRAVWYTVIRTITSVMIGGSMPARAPCSYSPNVVHLSVCG